MHRARGVVAMGAVTTEQQDNVGIVTLDRQCATP
jgi:hypothetical protein